MKKAYNATKVWRNKFKARDPEGYKTYRREEARKYRQKPYVKEANRKRTKKYLIKNPVYGKNKRLQIKFETIKQYGGICECCGENRWELLTIDHIDGSGGPDRKKEKVNGGHSFYQRLKKRNWPKNNYRLLCFNCNCARGFYGYCPHELELIAWG